MGQIKERRNSGRFSYKEICTQGGRKMTEEEEKDIEFLQKYELLCKEYNKCIDIVDYDEVGVIREECSNYSFSMPEKRAENTRKQKQLFEEDLRNKKEEYKKAVEEYVKNGGTLNIHGEIPTTVSKNYCQPISFSDQNSKLFSSGATFRWGKNAVEYNKASQAAIEIIKSGLYKSQDIQDILSKQGFYFETIREVITELWEQGKINFGEDFRIKLIDSGDEDG
jgi:hypothetical protein